MVLATAHTNQAEHGVLSFSLSSSPCQQVLLLICLAACGCVHARVLGTVQSRSTCALEKSRYDTVCTLEISTPRLDYLGSYCTLFLEWRQWQSLVVVTLFQKAKAHVMAILLSDNKNNHELHQTWVHGKSHPAPHCFNCASHLPS